MKKKIFALSLILLLTFNIMKLLANDSLIPISGVVLNDQINFKIDGTSVVPVGDDGTRVLPISYNGTTYLPVRAMGYLLGLGIDYEATTKTVLITSSTTKSAPSALPFIKSNQLIAISNVVLNKALNFKLDNVAVIPVGDDGSPVLPISYNGTTYLPVRAMGYLLGLGIDYEATTKTVLITRDNPNSSPITESQVWKLKEVKFTDGTRRTDSVLMGTSSGLYDLISYTGGQNDLTITANRYDTATNKLLAGVVYQVSWTDPPQYLVPNEKISVDYSLNTISTYASWNAGQHSIYLNQGWGINFVSSDGVKYINSDMSSTFTSEKVIEKGAKGQTRTIQFQHSQGFKTEYIYEWIE